ncbi:hypothetical protein ACI782_04010 [Geodermatophilus sp. SYSU D00703]
MHQPTTSPEPARVPDAPSAAAGTQQLPRTQAGPPVQATGPVDFVPGPPGAGTLPPPVATAPRPRKGREARTRRDPLRQRPVPVDARQRASLAGAGLAALCLLLVEVGLTVGFGEASLWSTVPLWSAFATLAGLLGLLPFAGRVVAGVRRRPEAAWRVAAAGLTGLAVFWVLVVLPQVDSNRGFVLTGALAALGAALWIAPARRR